MGSYEKPTLEIPPWSRTIEDEIVKQERSLAAAGDESIQLRKPPVPLLPWNRGEPEEGFLSPDDISLELPRPEDVGSLALPAHLEGLADAFPAPRIGDLTGVVPSELGSIGTQPLKRHALSLADVLTGQALALVDETRSTVSSFVERLAAAVPPLPPGDRRVAATEIAEQAIDYRLTASANGLTQSFDLILCLPTLINVEGTDQTLLAATTVVTLCPVPLHQPLGREGSGHDLVVQAAPGQPVQLYLSVRRLPRGDAIPASFEAEYDVPDPEDPTQDIGTLRFGIDSSSQAYPSPATVGMATDFNPTSGRLAQAVTMSWALEGSPDQAADAVYVEAEDVGRVAILRPPQHEGYFLLSHADGRLESEFALLADRSVQADPSVVVSAAIPTSEPGDEASGVLTWSSVPKKFTFSLGVTQVDGRPSGIDFDGAQVQKENDDFTFGLDYLVNDLLAGRLRQTGFGLEFAEQVQVLFDEARRPSGIHVQASAGETSTLDISSYEAGQIAAFAELVGMPPAASEVSLQIKGSSEQGGAGVHIAGVASPAYIGAASYIKANGARGSTQQASLEMSTGAPHGPAPFSVDENAPLYLRMERVYPEFQVEITSPTSGAATHSAAGFEIAGSTGGTWPDGKGVGQLMLRARGDSGHWVGLVFNSLLDRWEFRGDLKGTTSAPAGIEIASRSFGPNPQELKQVWVQTSLGSPPKYTLTIRRPGSDMRGYRTPGGLQALIFNPGWDFDMSFERDEEVSGSGVRQTLAIRGVNHAAASLDDYVEVSTDAASFRVDEQMGRQGTWKATVTGQSASPDEDLDSFAVKTAQSWGANPSARVVLEAPGSGRLSVASLASATEVGVKLLRDASGDVVGGRIDGTGSEANPSREIHLDQLASGGAVTSAINILGEGVSDAAAYGGSEITGVITRVPDTFGLKLTRPNERSVVLVSNNPDPAPDMTAKFLAPAPPGLPGKTIRVEVRSFDTATRLRFAAASASDTPAVVRTVGSVLWGPIQLPPVDAGPVDVRATIESWNAGANPRHVVSAALLTASGSPTHAVLLHRPSADLAGLPLAGSRFTGRWERMPRMFELEFSAELAANGTGHLGLALTGAAAAPNGELRIEAADVEKTAVFRGTGQTQRFEVEIATSPDETKTLKFVGSFPPAAKNVEIYRLVGDTTDFLAQFANPGGPFEASGTSRGTELYIIPAGDLDVTFETGQERVLGIDFTSTEPGTDVNLYRYNQLDGDRYCLEGGVRYPCFALNLWAIPQKVDFSIAQKQGKAMPDVDYRASDSDLLFWLRSLNPGLAGAMYIAGVPSEGFVARGNLPDGPGASQSQQLSFSVESRLGQELPWFQFYAYDQPLPHVDETRRAIHDGGWYSIVGLAHVNLHYRTTLMVHSDGGVQKFVAEWVPPAGLAVGARGAPGSRVSLSFWDTELSAGDRIAWGWEFWVGGPFLVDSESDGTALGSYDGVFSFYTWESWQGDPLHRSGTGCSPAKPPAINMALFDWTWPSVPFQPGFDHSVDWVEVCAGHVAYYMLNPEDLLFKRCRWSYGCSNEHSFVSVPGVARSDWIFAAWVKASHEHNDDPNGLWAKLS